MGLAEHEKYLKEAQRITVPIACPSRILPTLTSVLQKE